MLESASSENQRVLGALVHEIRQARRPLALWVGAGAGVWGGYPLWQEFAERVHRDFMLRAAGYDKARGADLLSTRAFPSLFQHCRDCDEQRFYRILSESFEAREISPVYRRFNALVSKIAPEVILTTNVDGLLERPGYSTNLVHRDDLERAIDFVQRGVRFVCPLHGSVSAIRSTVFTSEDYASLLAGNFGECLERLLSLVSIIFVGYGLQDDYVLRLLEENQARARLLGDGPHFAIIPEGADVQVPRSVEVIRYRPEPYKDHRSALQVLEEVREYRKVSRAETNLPPAAAVQRRSGHMLTSIYAAGTYKTGQIITVKDPTGKESAFFTGPGWSDDELQGVASTALHDLVVGLVCFEQVYAPLFTIGQIGRLVSSPMFWSLIREGALSLVHWEDVEAIRFPTKTAIAEGDLGTIRNVDESERSPGEVIRMHLRPIPGMEQAASRDFEAIESRVISFSSADLSMIPSLTRGLLLRPSVRAVLGISAGMPVTSIAKWHLYPVLRLASVVRVGETCRLLGLPSAKLDFGTDALAYPVFAASHGEHWTEDAASFVVAGRFSADLGRQVARDPAILQGILRFRDSEAGARLRAAVAGELRIPGGGDVDATINAGLHQSISTNVLQNARDRFLDLLVPSRVIENGPPAIWSDSRNGEVYLRRWRSHSLKVLQEHCEASRVDPYDACPCGSGDKLKFCCLEALSAAP